MLLKRFASIVAIVGISSIAQAGQIGPDSFGYVARDVPYSFTNIAATGTSILWPFDNAFGFANIGFTFDFYGAAYTTALVYTNGVVTFFLPIANPINQDLTGALTIDVPTFAPLWDDYYLGNTPPMGGGDPAARIYYQTVGAVGSREFIVQWNNVKPGAFSVETDRVTFQMRLFEGSNNILFSYLDTDTSLPDSSTSGASNGRSATVGIRDVNGNTNGRNLQWSFNQKVIASESSILFEVPSQEIPEPGTIVLTGLGLCAAVLGRRRFAGRN